MSYRHRNSVEPYHKKNANYKNLVENCLLECRQNVHYLIESRV
jgi:hypothetical protein